VISNGGVPPLTGVLQMRGNPAAAIELKSRNNLPHVRQDLHREARNPLSTREISEAELKMVTTGGSAVFEGLYELVGGAVNRALFAEERAFSSDLFRLFLGISDRHT
jgi:hypothetical protein